MTCVLHPAGKKRPAPLPSADAPHRPDGLTGRFQARRSLLLPALVLLGGCCASLSAAPAQAQTNFWSATLTVDQSDFYFGCDNNDSRQDNCSIASVLTDDDFIYKGITYTIEALYFAENSLNLAFSKNNVDLTYSQIQAALGSLVLNVPGAALKIKDAIDQDAGVVVTGVISLRYEPTKDWTDGLKVSLSLTGPDATLSALTGNTSTDGSSFTGTLNISTFASSTTSYTATVENTVTHVKLTPTVNDSDATVNDSDATVKVGKQGSSLTTVSSGSASSAIALAVGSNALKVEVTAEDGTTTQTYTVTVTRQAAASTDATLSALTGNTSTDGSSFTGTLNIGTFASSTTSYTATVENTVTHVKLTPTVNDSDATVKVGKQGSSLTTVSSGSASSAIALAVGSNALKVEVTAEDGTTTQTYTVTVTRQAAASTDATLSALTGNTSTDGSSFTGTLNIGTFTSSTTSYTATVENTVTHVKLTPTVNDSDATVKVGKQGSSLTTVSSGSASSAIALAVGSNALKVEVTAEDGTTTQTYTVTVTRQQPANAPTDTPTNKSTPPLTKISSPNNPPGIHPPPPPLQETLPPVVSVRGGEPVTEGGEARFTLSTTPAPASGNTIEVNVSVSQHGDFAGRTQTGSRTVVIDESGTAVFTVATAEDAVHEPDGAVTVVVEGGTGYTPHGGDNRASVTVEDNDDPALVVSPSSLKLTEGGSASYTVTLATGPTGVVRVSVSGHGATDLILEPASPLVFTPENWSTPQVVVVSAPQPSNAVGHSFTLSHVATGSGYGSAPPVAVKVGVRADPTGKNAWHIRFVRTVSHRWWTPCSSASAAAPRQGYNSPWPGRPLPAIRRCRRTTCCCPGCWGLRV